MERHHLHSPTNRKCNTATLSRESRVHTRAKNVLKLTIASSVYRVLLAGAEFDALGFPIPETLSPRCVPSLFRREHIFFSYLQPNCPPTPALPFVLLVRRRGYEYGTDRAPHVTQRRYEEIRVTFPAARARQLTALEAYKVRACSHNFPLPSLDSRALDRSSLSFSYYVDCRGQNGLPVR